MARQPTVTRAHLKQAVENQMGDLLDRLLEINSKHINDNALFTDSWGEWWGMLCECARRGWIDGVHILLKHGANPKASTWGDCIPMSALELAEDKPNIRKLLTGQMAPQYIRQSEPELPQLSDKDGQVNRQGEIADATVLVFPTDEL